MAAPTEDENADYKEQLQQEQEARRTLEQAHRREIKNLEKQLQQERQNCGHLTRQVEGLEEALQVVQTQASDLKRENASITNANKALQRETEDNARMQAQASNTYEESHSALEQRVRSLQQELDEAKEREHETIRQKEVVQQRNQNLQDELRRLESAHQQLKEMRDELLLEQQRAAEQSLQTPRRMDGSSSLSNLARADGRRPLGGGPTVSRTNRTQSVVAFNNQYGSCPPNDSMVPGERVQLLAAATADCVNGSVQNSGQQTPRSFSNLDTPRASSGGGQTLNAATTLNAGQPRNSYKSRSYQDEGTMTVDYGLYESQPQRKGGDQGCPCVIQ